MVQSVTTGSISGSVAGNHQSYSISGSMKRENSNESGSIMRNQDFLRPYGSKQDYNDQNQPRPRFQSQSQEEIQDQRRMSSYNQKDFKNINMVPTEYQVAYLNEYQSSSDHHKATKSSRMSTSQVVMTIPDEKTEYNQVLEVNQYLDDEFGPTQDTPLQLDDRQRQQYMYSAQEFNKESNERRINHAHLMMDQRMRKTKTSLQTMSNTPHKQENQSLQTAKNKSGNPSKMIFGQQKNKQMPNQLNKLCISNQSTSNLNSQNYGNVKIMPQSALNKTQSQAMLLNNLQNGLDQSARGPKQAYQHTMGQKNSENSLLFIPEGLRDLTQSQSQSSLNIIVNSPRIQSAVRHLRPGTTLSNNKSYVPENLIPQHNFMTGQSQESVSILSNKQKSISKDQSRQQVPLTQKQQEMQRQHNLLKAKFAKYALTKPKFQSTKSLSDLLQRNRSRGDTVDSSNRERQSLPQPVSSTRQIKSKNPNSIIMHKNDKTMTTQTSRNGEKQQLTAVTLQKTTRGENTLNGTKIVEENYELRSPKNLQLQQLTQRQQFDQLAREQNKNVKIVFNKGPLVNQSDHPEQLMTQRSSKDNQIFLISPKGIITSHKPSDSRIMFDQNENQTQKFSQMTLMSAQQPQNKQNMMHGNLQSSQQYGMSQSSQDRNRQTGKSPLSLDDTTILNQTSSLDRTVERTVYLNPDMNQFATSAISEISKHAQQKVVFQETQRSVSRGQQSKLLPKPHEDTSKHNYNQPQTQKQQLLVANIQLQKTQRLPQATNNLQKQQNLNSNAKKRDLMFKRQSNEIEKKPEHDHLQVSIAHAVDNYQTVQATHNLILQLSNRQTPQQTSQKLQSSGGQKNQKSMPRTNSVTQITKPPMQYSDKKQDDEGSEEKKLQSNNSVNCLFGPKSHFIQESTPKPKLDKIILDQIIGSDQSVQTTKAFGPTNTIFKAKGANLYQKINLDENEDQAVHQHHGSSSFKSDYVDYQHETMGEMHQAKSLEELTQQLREACTRGDFQFVKQLAQMQSELKTQIANSVNKEGWTPLHFAAYSGHADILETLIRKLDASVDAQNKLGQTPLHLACKKAHKKVIERLLLARANTEIKDCLAGNTALHVLAASDKLSNPISNGSSVVGTQKSRAEDFDVSRSDNYSTDKNNKNSTHSSDPNKRNIVDKEVRQRAKLIDLMLPFAKSCKQMQNRNGNFPWQLAQNPQIVKLLLDAHVPATVQSQPKVASNHFVRVSEKQQSECEEILQASSRTDLGDKSNFTSTNQRSINEKSKSSGFQTNAKKQNEKTSNEGCSLQEESKQQRPITSQDCRQTNDSTFQLLKTPKNPQKEVNPVEKDTESISVKQHIQEQRNREGDQIAKHEITKVQKTPEISIRDTVKAETRIQTKSIEKTEAQKKQDHSLQLEKEALKESTKAQLKRLAVKTNDKPRSQSRDISQFQFEDIVGPDNFVAHQLLGTGSFGEVFLVERKTDKQLLAMKVLSKKRVKQQNLKKYAMTERNVMGMMGKHPFIVELRYAFQTKEHLFLVSDYCPGGDLSQYLEIEGQFSEEKARLFTQEILLAIEMLHEGNVIFRDLKPDNVIIDSQGHALLTDFGLSRENVRKSEFGAKSFCGSYAYLAPEMLKKAGHGKAVDWYLLGVILYEMVTGLPPYYADDKEELFQNIIKNDLDLKNTGRELNLSQELLDLLQKLLEKDPSKRLGTKGGATEVKAHPFFKGTKWGKIMSRELQMPDAYLAKMAMDIIKQQPYLVAGHPHTVGEICPKEHASYYPNWTYNYEIVKDAGQINRLTI